MNARDETHQHSRIPKPGVPGEALSEVRRLMGANGRIRGAGALAFVLGEARPACSD